MKAKVLAKEISSLGIRMITGVPDSTLQEFCTFLGREDGELFDSHIVPANEGAAIGLAVGEYLATGNPACVYMQNSGLGNTVNPITSLANHKVYGIPMLLLIGWRGEPGTRDEPQHKFMGEITEALISALDIPYSIIDASVPETMLPLISEKIRKAFAERKQYALLIKKGTFEKEGKKEYQNSNILVREKAIREIIQWLQPEDIVVSTTGKISRELYENMNAIKRTHEQAFLCVGGMGHANMIAYQMAKRRPDKRVICMDGDGALLMHMGSLAVMGSHPVNNLIHICLDNEAHESVGGMYTGARGIEYEGVAKACGYKNVYSAESAEVLQDLLKEAGTSQEMCFIRIRVSISSRADLVRPKETAQENAAQFMRYHNRG